MANTSVIRQQAAPTTYQLSSPSCSTRAIQKKPVITGTKRCEEKRACVSTVPHSSHSQTPPPKTKQKLKKTLVSVSVSACVYRYQ